MSEKDLLLNIMQRLKDNGGIDEYHLNPSTPHNGGDIMVDSNGWHGYGIRFAFDKDGNITETSAGA